ncbi:MAG: hypothetical protein JXR50_08140 [Prolixibacteraceae bacterium]|nr:hypothetical protein [Prolixibacteraceae bacterium]MBN2649693.1 hypothetical protein [Prolixibacteraceae bacterium]
MKITRKNYEEWLIDWLDNNLTVEQIDEVRLFLRANPDLQNEFNGIEKAYLPAETVPCVDFSMLKKTRLDDTDVFEDACIRSIEGQLSVGEENELREYLGHNAKAKYEYQLFESTRLKPDETIVYGNIDSLKQQPSLPTYWYRAAAAIVLLFSFFWWQHGELYEPDYSPHKIVALNEEPQTGSINISYKPKLHSLVESSENIAEVLKVESNNLEYGKIQLLASQIVILPQSEIVSDLEDISLKEYNIVPVSDEEYPGLGELLAEKINLEKGKNKLTVFALDKLKGLTNDKFDYSASEEGEVEKIEFNTRILAFSVPLE